MGSNVFCAHGVYLGDANPNRPCSECADGGPQNHTETEVPCGTCGAKLTAAEVLELWSDRDWVYHRDGHRICVREADGQGYYAIARRLTQERVEAGLSLYQ